MGISAVQIAKETEISRSYLYYLKNRGVFNVPKVNGRLKWNKDVIEDIKLYLQSRSKNTKTIKTKPRYKIIHINNRRYLGNKYKLIPFIRNIVNNYCEDINTVADIFSGTGAVASAFIDKKIITNDIMYSNYICHVAWFGVEKYSKQKIISYIVNYNSLLIDEENYMTKNFSNTYFSKSDCSKIGYIRENIEQEYNKGKINLREKAILITSLLYAMDKIANTCGHYDAYRKKSDFNKKLELNVPIPCENVNDNNLCYNESANDLVKEIEADLVYIDPPYNSRQYCDAYHLLENVARWEKPEVYGVARKMDRSKLKSNYCTNKATEAFEDLIDSIQSKYILLSYNNMSHKGNERSNAKISDEEISRILKKKGRVKVFSQKYKAFTTGKSKIKENEERLFLCECYNKEKKIIQSPLNYIGGKYKLIEHIKKFFPKNIVEFVDLFCGGCNVGINVECNKVVFNDLNVHLIGMYNKFKKMRKSDIFKKIFYIISKYKLSRSDLYGYDYYGCNGSDGLSKYNKNKFLRLRKDFNEMNNYNEDYYLYLYTLIVFSFNNQLRFNSKRKFNLPVGKRDFNSKMQIKLDGFINRIKSGDYKFTCRDFENISLNKNSFVYVDPPYLITCATYNEKGGWNDEEENRLLKFLDRINQNNIKFALSNVLESKGKKNEILYNWIKKNHNTYKVINLNYNYSNSNYHIKNKSNITKEVLIINYG